MTARHAHPSFALLVILAARAAAGGIECGAGDSNRLPASLPPEIYAWFWVEDAEFAGEGYKTFVDMIVENSNFGLLTTTLRAPKREITRPDTHDQIKRGVEYARSRGLRVALDLDVRLARGTFRRRFPDQQQWMLRIRSFPAGSRGRAEIESMELLDHMTWPEARYDCMRGRVAAVFRFDRGRPQAPLIAVSDYKTLEESPRRVVIEAAPGERPASTELILAAAFEHETPDVFAPDLLRFQRDIYDQYADVPLDGALKDEWGFPPVFNQGPKDGDFWYSSALEAEYGRAGGGDFIRDAVLMTLGAGASHEQRLAAVNRYMRLILTRNAAVETAYYELVKRTFGPRAFAGTHATWGFMPSGDAFKNGYDWWQARRDYGQTDEHWPLPVRTSLAKKMGGPVWFNQFYDPRIEAYAAEIWRNARAGGRVNFHPPWPSVLGTERDLLLRSPVMQAARRIRLLNFVSRAPVDSPVAVVFGHAAALNWVGPHFGDLGVDFAEELWAMGLRADVIPSTEIQAGALRVAEDGSVTYGPQRYRAMVFVNPEYEPISTFEFLRAAARSKTAVFLRGASRRTFQGRPRPAEDSMVAGAMVDPTPGRVAQYLWNWHTDRVSALDPVRLTDGACMLARGESDPAGDPIAETFFCGGFRVTVRAKGVVAVRFTGAELDGFAASDLESFEGGQIVLRLDRPADVALWREPGGAWRGVFQGAGAIPEELLRITKDWGCLNPGHAGRSAH